MRTLLMPSCLSEGCCKKKATAQAAQAADFCVCQFRSLGRPGSRCWQIPAEEGPLLCVQMTAFSFCPHVAEKRSKLSPLSSRKDTNPISGTLLSPTLCSHAGQLPGSGRLCVCAFSFLRLKEPPNFLYHIRRSALTRKPPQPIPIPSGSTRRPFSGSPVQSAMRCCGLEQTHHTRCHHPSVCPPSLQTFCPLSILSPWAFPLKFSRIQAGERKKLQT